MIRPAQELNKNKAFKIHKRRTILASPSIGREPELFLSEISNVSQNRKRLRARGKRSRCLWFSKLTVENIGKHNREKHRGGCCRSRHLSTSRDSMGQEGKKLTRVSEDAAKKEE